MITGALSNRGRFGALWDTGGGSNGAQTVNTTQSNEPPAYAAPYLGDVLAKAGQVYNSNYGQFYPNATYTPASQNSLASISGTTDIANTQNAANQGQSAFSQVNPAAANTALQTVRGDYLSPDSNPFLRANVDAATRPTRDAYTQSVVPAINASFAQNGRLGGGLNVLGQTQAADTLLRNVGEQSNQLYGQNYQMERGLQNQMVGQAPSIAESQYNPLQHLAQAGSAQEGYANQQLQDSIARWNQQQQAPWSNLANYASIVRGGTVGSNSSGSQTIPTYGSPLMQGIGTGIAGLGALGSLWSAFK